MQCTVIQKKISFSEFSEGRPGPEDKLAESFEASAEGRALLEKEAAQRTDQRLCRRQAERYNKAGFSASLKRTFLNIYTSSKLGLDISKLAGGERGSSEQSKFRKDLLEMSGQVHPVKKMNRVWCPVISQWLVPSSIVAAHIFPYKSGQDAMVSIFGDEARDELFSANNGIAMFRDAEEKFDSGAIVLVPDVRDDASTEEMISWNARKVKDYKIRVVRPQDVGMDLICEPQSNMTWQELDGKPVAFKSDFRPRARYLYYAYCVAMMRRGYHNEPRSVTLKDQLGNKFWGTVGPYIRKSMLDGFVTLLGHDYEGLLDGAMAPEDDDSDEPDEIAVASANAQILRPLGENEDDENPVFSTSIEDEDDEDDEEDDEEQDEENLALKSY